MNTMELMRMMQEQQDLVNRFGWALGLKGNLLHMRGPYGVYRAFGKMCRDVTRTRVELERLQSQCKDATE